MAHIHKYPVRSHYLVKFSDEEFQLEWKIKNLSAFVRDLFSSNKVLRNAWESKYETPKEFAKHMIMKLGSMLNHNRKVSNETTAILYLLPTDHADYKTFYAIVTRSYPTKDYTENTLTTKKFKR